MRWELDTVRYYRFIGLGKYRRAAGIAYFKHKSADGSDDRGLYILDTHWLTDGAGNRGATMQMIDAYKKVNENFVKHDDVMILMGDFNHEFITYRESEIFDIEDFSPFNPGYLHNANAEQLAGGRDKTFHNFTYEFTEPIPIKPNPDVNPRIIDFIFYIPDVNPGMIDFIFYMMPLVLRHTAILHSPAQRNLDTTHGLASDHFPVTASFLLP